MARSGGVASPEERSSGASNDSLFRAAGLAEEVERQLAWGNEAAAAGKLAVIGTVGREEWLAGARDGGEPPGARTDQSVHDRAEPAQPQAVAHH